MGAETWDHWGPHTTIMNRVRAICVGMMAVLLIGCDRKTVIEDQGTPEAVLYKMQSAILNGDDEALAECITGPKGCADAMKAGARYARAVYRFEDALAKAYGATAVDDFRTIKTNPSVELLVPPRDPKQTQEVNIKVEGDVATFLDPALNTEGKLVRRNGVWFLAIPEGMDCEALERMYDRWATAVERATKRVGRAGVTLEQLKTELAEATRAAMRK